MIPFTFVRSCCTVKAPLLKSAASAYVNSTIRGTSHARSLTSSTTPDPVNKTKPSWNLKKETYVLAGLMIVGTLSLGAAITSTFEANFNKIEAKLDEINSMLHALEAEIKSKIDRKDAKIEDGQGRKIEEVKVGAIEATK
jgi:hypothetical protein